MKILFDYQTFSLQNFGGISRYYAELVNGVNQTERDVAYLPLVFSNNVHLRESGISVRNFLLNQNFYKKQQIIYRTNKLYTIAQLSRKNFDIFHPTYYDPYFIPHLKSHPFTITFLDMIHERFGTKYKELSDGGLITKNKQLLADRADKIIAISESTKRDIVELLGVDPRKIEVIYLGNSLCPVENVNTSRQAPEPYLLFVGRRERYKNFDGLLQIIHPILKKYGLKLICAGGDPFTSEEQERICKVGADKLVRQQPINDHTLTQLYHQATAFIFPTLYEGFGIPVLEAFACNCPCIVSNLSSLPEVAGDAALYFDPNQPESIAVAIEKLLCDTQLRQMLIEKGRTQLNRFSWQRTVNETLRFYRTLL
jgi:glycosyltransferase involved in cell wall biosynthesis